MRIIGVDPGLIATGYGVIDAADEAPVSCLAAGVIRPDSRDLSARLLQLHQQLTALLREFHPDVLAVEDLFSTYAHPKTAILMGHARGVIYLAAAQCGVPVISYASTALKQAMTGRGRASKEQVQAMVQRLLRLPTLPTPDHVSDALALALCHAHRERGGAFVPSSCRGAARRAPGNERDGSLRKRRGTTRL